MTLKDDIRAAFATSAPPSAEPITSHRCPECDEVEAFFRAKDRYAHSVEELRYHHEALSFLTPSAFVHFLPAFMIATLDDPEAADMIPCGIAWHLEPTGESADRAKERLSLLTDRQAEVTIRFLDNLVAMDILERDEVVSATGGLRGRGAGG